MTEFSFRVGAVLDAVPYGRVASYGQIAEIAGKPQGARQVVRLLSNSSRGKELKWHRIVRKDGSIALPIGRGFELQKALLESEGIVVDEHGRVDLTRFQWQPAGQF